MQNACKIRGFFGMAGSRTYARGFRESRPLPKSVILFGFFAPSFPAATARSRPFPTAPLENVRKAVRQ